MGTLGFYGRHVAPRIVHATCGSSLTTPLRQRVCAGLTGRVVEIGFGSGHNITHYPAAITSVAAIEPADLAWKLAAPRLQDAAVPIDRAGVDGQRLTLADGSMDAALSTWTLCSIDDPAAALLEVHRVLRPGGTFHFVEHGLAPDPDVRRRQHRMEPFHRSLLGGCHLTRPVADMITAAGLVVTEIDEFYEQAGPRYAGFMSLGIATKPAG